MICPVCEDRPFIWTDEDYYRCAECTGWFPYTEKGEEINTIIGEWESEELAKLEVALEKYCDNNFVFFKGKNIIAAWQKNRTGNRIVMAKSLNRLIQLIG